MDSILTKKCENFSKCKNMCGEKYKYCQQCNNQFGKDNAIVEISKTLKQMNWNLGMRNEFMKQTNPELWNKIQKEWKEKNKDPDLDNA